MAAASVGLVALVWCFTGIAFLIGAATGRRGTVLAVTGVIGVATYMANAIGGMAEGVGWLRWLSPFHYFIGTDPLHTGWHPGALLAARRRRRGHGRCRGDPVRPTRRRCLTPGLAGPSTEWDSVRWRLTSGGRTSASARPARRRAAGPPPRAMAEPRLPEVVTLLIASSAFWDRGARSA